MTKSQRRVAGLEGQEDAFVLHMRTKGLCRRFPQKGKGGAGLGLANHKFRLII